MGVMVLGSSGLYGMFVVKKFAHVLFDITKLE